MLIGSIVLFALVAVLLALAFLRPGAGRGTPPGWWLAGGGLALPTLVLTPLLVYALWSGERLFAAPSGAPPIEVVARQFEWRFGYPGANGEAAHSTNVLHIVAGERVRLRVSSEDVIHSFWVPRLAGKIDAIPGHVNTLQISADAPGVYRGLCAEFCGTAHLEMQFSVHAHATAAERDAALGLAAGAAAGATPEAERRP